MKSVFFAVLAFIVFLSAAYAQQFENESELYPRTVFVNKIYSDANGYKIEYMKNSVELASFWAPREWFYGDERIGTILTGENPSYPYITFFFKDGVVSHFHLYVWFDRLHPSWAHMEKGKDYSAEYPPIDSKPEIQF